MPGARVRLGRRGAEMARLLSHVRRFAGDVRRDWRRTAEQSVLDEFARRAATEPRRTPGSIAVAPYRIDYVDAMTAWPQWDDLFVRGVMRVAFTTPAPRILDGGANLFAYDTATGKDLWEKRTLGGFGRQITLHSADDFSGVISPDGKTMLTYPASSPMAGSIPELIVPASLHVAEQALQFLGFNQP